MDANAPEVSIRFVRHNDNNETILCAAGDEQSTFESLGVGSSRYGAELWIDGDVVSAKPA